VGFTGFDVMIGAALGRRIDQYKKFKEFLGPRVFKLFIAAIGVGVLAFCVEASFVLISQGFLNALGIVGEEQLRLPQWYPRGVLPSVLFLVLFGFGRGLVMGLKRFLSSYTGQAFTVQQRKQLFVYGLRNANKVSSSELMGVFGDRVREAGVVLQNFSNFAVLATSATLLFFTGLKIAPYELLLGMILLAFFMLPFARTTKTITKQGQKIVKDWDKTNRHLVSGLRNFFLLMIYKKIDREIEAGSDSLDAYLNRHRIYSALASMKSVIPLTIGTAVIAVLTVVSRKYIHTESLLLLALFYIFVRISQSLGEMSFSLSALRFNYPSFKLLYSWHKKYIHQSQSQALIRAKKIRKISFPIKVQLKKVSFRYDESSSWVIFQKDLVVAPGNPLIIKGPSGAGKSTLLKLILGVEGPQQGEVLYNEVPVEELEEAFWDRVSYVGPDPFLIEGSFRENLLYGHPAPATVSDEALEKGLRQAQLWGEVIFDRAGLGQPLSDHAELSTGQRQRLSIARAFVRQAEFYIFDEATANLDSASEGLIIKELAELLRERTGVVVTHKPAFDSLGEVLDLSP